ncbi:MAG: hypothetical protein OEX03_01000 [Gammaproteobacteria bacterium]|nr:hypothetical protein [Gammaproteobacteria bacterium]
MRIINTLFITTLLFLSINAHSSEADKISKYFQSREFQKQLFELGVYWDRNILNIQTDCKSQYHLLPVSYSFIKPLKFETDSIHPSEGIFTFRYEFKRCNEIITYNALVSAQAGKGVKLSALVPGTTRVSPQLLKDLYIGGVSGMVATKRKNQECQKTTVTDTKVTLDPTATMSGKNNTNGMWEEFWTVKHCAETIEMSFCFIPDANGGTSWSSGKCVK